MPAKSNVKTENTLQFINISSFGATRVMSAKVCLLLIKYTHHYFIHDLKRCECFVCKSFCCETCQLSIDVLALLRERRKIYENRHCKGMDRCVEQLNRCKSKQQTIPQHVNKNKNKTNTNIQTICLK